MRWMEFNIKKRSISGETDQEFTGEVGVKDHYSGKKCLGVR